MSVQADKDPALLLHAAFDGELDAAGMLALEEHMARDPQLALEYKKIAALQGAARAKLPKYTAPPRLRQKIAEMAAPHARMATRTFPARPRRAWLAYAATALIAAGLGSSATMLTMAPVQSTVGSAIIAAHMRGLLAASPVDVVSSDRHTVKPWFDAHLGVSPPVLDLTAQGYELLGGRVDIVAGAPAPTLVYKAREHLISVTAVSKAQAGAAAAAAQSSGGYKLVSWLGGDFIFWAASDIELPELDAFASAFKRAQQL